MVAELRDLQQRFGDDRRTRIVDDAANVPTSIEDLVPNLSTVVALGDDGTLKRLDQFGGRASARETPHEYVTCNVRDLLLLFTASGACHGVFVHKISPVARRSDHGVAVATLVDLAAGERIVSVVAVGANVPPYLVFCTRQGQVKRTPAADYLHARSAPVVAINLDQADELLTVETASGEAETLLHTRQGKAIRFSLDDVRATKRVAGGVRAIRLDEGDSVVQGMVVHGTSQIVVLTAAGVGRRTAVHEYPVQGRDGSGVKSIRISDKSGPVVSVFSVDERASLEAVDGAGRAIVLEVRDLPLQDRSRPGTVVADGIKQAVVLPRR